VSHTLSPPATDEDWRAFHDIREAVLWTARGRSGYDRQHAHDYEVPANQPLLLKDGGRPVGTVRIDDFGDGTGAVRLVAVVSEGQGRGHGRVLSDLWDDYAKGKGLETLYVNAAPEALGFYEKMGWERFIWDETELFGIAEECIQMRKRL
jgi:N-acetylglutamate synthase-like GNAT family acetyltransferase